MTRDQAFRRTCRQRRIAVHTNPFAPFLTRSGAAVLDGALATELERRGADLNDPLWSARLLIEQPALIRRVHDDYFTAGADVAISATYQATYQGLSRRGLDDRAATALFADAVQLAIDARNAYWAANSEDAGRVKPLVAASVGPYGAFLADGSEYRGNYALDEDALVAWHRKRFAVLAASGADLLACETIPCAAEARALLRLLVEHPDARAWVTFTARDGVHIADGEPFADVVRECVTRENVVAVGVNCTAPQHVESLIRAARAVTDTPIIVYPNSGETYDAVSHRWVAERACPPFVDYVATWLDAGATIVGGCCRTTPDDIRAVRSLVDSRHELRRPGAAPPVSLKRPQP